MMEEKYTYKLLVEGNEDVHVILALWNAANRPESFDIINCHSVQQLLKNLKIRLTVPLTNQRIGIVVDADTDISARWDSIKSHLDATGKYNCKKCQLQEGGLILPSINPEYPTIGVWIMPNNKLPGMLEDFVAALAPTDDPLMEKAEDVLNQLEKSNIQRYKPVHRSKAKIHSYLAWQDEPGRPMGQSITAHVLNPNSKTGQLFLDWLQILFT